jgi:hypothetical protein
MVALTGQLQNDLKMGPNTEWLIRGVFVYSYGPFQFGSDRSAINKQFEPFQYHFVDPLLDSSTASHVKNGLVLSKRLRPGPTMEWSDPNRTKKRMLLVPAVHTSSDQSIPVNEHTQYLLRSRRQCANYNMLGRTRSI